MESTPRLDSEGQAVVRVLAVVLERLVGANSHLAQADQGQVTKFHALRAPAIGIGQYLDRIHKYASCSNECFILALIYIDRLIQRNNFLLTELNVHRVVITAVLLAAKFFDDAYYNNAYYAKVGGVLVSEMNSLEVEFLFRINFSLRVLPDVFEKYNAELIAHASAMGLKSPPQCSPDTLFHGALSSAEIRASQQNLSLDILCPDASMHFPSNASCNLQVQHSGHAMITAAQAQIYHNQLINHINGMLSQPIMQSSSQITPSPPPQPPAFYANGVPVTFNHEEVGCANPAGLPYASNIAAHQQLPINFNAPLRLPSDSTDTTSCKIAHDLQQRLLLAGSIAVGNAIEEQNSNWSNLCQVFNQNCGYQKDVQLGDLISTSSSESGQYMSGSNGMPTTENGMSVQFESSAPMLANVPSYSNVPFPNLPVNTTPLSNYSSKSSPGQMHFSESLNHTMSCTHSNYACIQANAANQPSQSSAMHQNYADYIVQSEIGLAWQRRHSDLAGYGGQHFMANRGSDIPLRSVVQYVNTSPRVGS